LPAQHRKNLAALCLHMLCVKELRILFPRSDNSDTALVGDYL